jgi:hypothetical protein
MTAPNVVDYKVRAAASKKTGAEITGALSPTTISLDEVFDDQQWFYAHPGRRHRLRPGWAIRRKGSAFLRSPAARDAPDDGDEGIAEAWWWRSAYPKLDQDTRNKLIKAARQKRQGKNP